jgi:hypothetical protein
MVYRDSFLGIPLISRYPTHFPLAMKKRIFSSMVSRQVYPAALSGAHFDNGIRAFISPVSPETIEKRINVFISPG